MKVKLSDFSRKYQKSVVKTKKKKAFANFSNENLWVVFHSRYIQIKFNCQSSRVSNPTPFISWYQPYQLDLVQVGEKNGNVKANQVPFIGPKFLLLTKRQFMAKEKKRWNCVNISPSQKELWNNFAASMACIGYQTDRYTLMCFGEKYGFHSLYLSFFPPLFTLFLQHAPYVAWKSKQWLGKIMWGS